MRRLIVNADDCNLTAGVTRAIVSAHRSGIVSSTTVLINQPLDADTASLLLDQKALGIGLHLNVTLGKPLTDTALIPSLMGESACFRRRDDQFNSPPKSGHIEREYLAQVERFTSVFGRLPTHLDSHHHVHDRENYFEVYCRVAGRFQLPVRRCRFFDTEKRAALPRTSDSFLGDLSPEGYWRKDKLMDALGNLPEGVTEIMCHPGIIDEALRKITGFIEGREKEYALFSDGALREVLTRNGAELTHYGLCYT